MAAALAAFAGIGRLTTRGRSAPETAATAVAATLTLWEPGLGFVLVPVAVGVAVSRVTLRVHHISDVLAGALLGLAGAVGASRLLF